MRLGLLSLPAHDHYDISGHQLSLAKPIAVGERITESISNTFANCKSVALTQPIALAELISVSEPLTFDQSRGCRRVLDVLSI